MLCKMYVLILQLQTTSTYNAAPSDHSDKMLICNTDPTQNPKCVKKTPPGFDNMQICNEDLIQITNTTQDHALSIC